MYKIRFFAPVLAAFIYCLPVLRGQTILLEGFASDPLARGWQVFGNSTLFQSNSTNQNVEVTWDSSGTNSYFHRPLGQILTKRDNFSLAFDLQLKDIAIGTSPGKPYTFQFAVG